MRKKKEKENKCKRIFPSDNSFFHRCRWPGDPKIMFKIFKKNRFCQIQVQCKWKTFCREILIYLNIYLYKALFFL